MTPDVARCDDEFEWAAAMLELSAWRGRWLQWFAIVESVVTETLVALSGLPGHAEHVRLRHLTGQKLEDLAALVSEGGVFAEAGRQVAGALLKFRQHDDLRNMLAHGHAKIAVERTGEWLAIFRMTVIRGQQSQRAEMVVEQADIGQLLLAIQRSGQSLTSHLKNFRNEVCPQSIATKPLSFSIRLSQPHSAG